MDPDMLREFYENGQYTDLVISPSSEGKNIHVHKAVIAAALPGLHRDRKKSIESGRLRLSYPRKTIKLLLRYVYDNSWRPCRDDFLKSRTTERHPTDTLEHMTHLVDCAEYCEAGQLHDAGTFIDEVDDMAWALIFRELKEPSDVIKALRCSVVASRYQDALLDRLEKLLPKPGSESEDE